VELNPQVSLEGALKSTVFMGTLATKVGRFQLLEAKKGEDLEAS